MFHRTTKRVAVLLVGLISHSIAGAQSPGSSGGDGFVHAFLPVPGEAVITPTSGRRQTYTLTRLEFADESAYGAWVPEGQYHLTGWNGDSLKGYPPIDVESGKVTDLGVLSSFDVGGFENVLMSWRHIESTRSVENVISSLGDSLISDLSSDWVLASVPDPVIERGRSSGQGMLVDIILSIDRNRGRPSEVEELRDASTAGRFVALALESMPPTFREPYVDSDGTRYYGAGFGRIRVRDKSGKWRTIDTGTLQRVTAVSKSADLTGVGFESGCLRTSSDQVAWKTADCHPQGHGILDLDWSGSEWVLVTGRTSPEKHNTIDRVEVYRGTSLSFAQLKQVYEIDFGEINGGLDFLEGKLRTNRYYVNIFPRLLRLDLVSGDWEVVNAPLDIWRYSVSDDGEVITVFPNTGTRKKKFYVSYDGGATWDSGRIAKAQKLSFDENGNGYAHQFRTTGLSRGHDISYFDPVSNKWRVVQTTPKECIMTLSDAAEEPVLCMTGDHRILRVEPNQVITEFSVGQSRAGADGHKD